MIEKSKGPGRNLERNGRAADLNSLTLREGVLDKNHPIWPPSFGKVEFQHEDCELNCLYNKHYYGSGARVCTCTQGALLPEFAWHLFFGILPEFEPGFNQGTTINYVIFMCRYFLPICEGPPSTIAKQHQIQLTGPNTSASQDNIFSGQLPMKGSCGVRTQSYWYSPKHNDNITIKYLLGHPMTTYFLVNARWKRQAESGQSQDRVLMVLSPRT